jgi:hypothetical protein
VDEVSLNGRGFFVTQNPATVTATLNTTLSKFNWCAYGSGAPPKALLKEDGSYTLHGTPPFTINGNIPVDDHTFAAGTCITAITDLTGNPAGFVPAVLINNTSPAALCGEGDVTLSATASGGTTTAMTYTWMVDGGEAQTTSTGSLLLPSVAIGSMTYSVAVTNAAGCTAEVKTGTITVSGIPTITLTSGNNDQTVDYGSAITDIIYTTTHASGASLTGQPANVSGSWSSNTYTISGTPTATGTFNYTVTTTNSNGCTSATATGTLTVNVSCTNCTIWTACSTVTDCNFTMVSSVAYENTTMNWATANTYCQNKGTGWRLPTRPELECMWRNKQYLPGGFPIPNGYWSSTTGSFGEYYTVDINTGAARTGSSSGRYLVKCVK